MLRAFGVTDKGRVRATNEDCFGINPELQLCVVADGMGGHNAGEVASQMAVDAVLRFIAEYDEDDTWPFGFDPSRSQTSNLLRTAVQMANRRVFQAAAGSSALSGMGTTLVAVLVRGTALSMAHVGDSRLYSLTRGRAEQLTSDDSWAATMLARDPSLDPALLKTHPMRNALTSVIGSRAEVDVHVAERQLDAEDMFLLTTDGVHGVLATPHLEAACEGERDLEGVARRLVQAALDGGSRDNCTAVVARFEVD